MFPALLDAGEAFDTTLLTSCAISNIICSMVYGSRYGYSDPMFTHLVASTRRRTELLFCPSVQVPCSPEASHGETAPVVPAKGNA